VAAMTALPCWRAIFCRLKEIILAVKKKERGELGSFSINSSVQWRVRRELNPRPTD
jgi:hypothetical protein